MSKTNETRTELHPALSLLPTSPLLFHRYKHLVQVLGWLWDLSVTEEHIFSKAFFYFVCLDIMLYSGKHGIYSNLGNEKKSGWISTLE